MNQIITINNWCLGYQVHLDVRYLPGRWTHVFSNGPLEGGQFCLYNATAVGITSVLSEDAPHLALHGVFPTGEAEVLDVTSWKPLKCFEVDKMDQLHAIHFDQLVSRWWFWTIFFYFHPFLLEDEPSLTSIFCQMGWFNHQLRFHLSFKILCRSLSCVNVLKRRVNYA